MFELVQDLKGKNLEEINHVPAIEESETLDPNLYELDQ